MDINYMISKYNIFMACPEKRNNSKKAIFYNEAVKCFTLMKVLNIKTLLTMKIIRCYYISK